MTFEQAARRQYRRHTLYAVYLVGPNGERERLGCTARKSGSGLLCFLREATTQALFKRLFADVESVSFTKRAEALLLSNGWSLVFGDTIRQEASQ